MPKDINVRQGSRYKNTMQYIQSGVLLVTFIIMILVYVYLTYLVFFTEDYISMIVMALFLFVTCSFNIIIRK